MWWLLKSLIFPQETFIFLFPSGHKQFLETQNSGDSIPDLGTDLTKQSLVTRWARPYQMCLPRSRISGEDTKRTPRLKCMPGEVLAVNLREEKTHDIAHDFWGLGIFMWLSGNGLSMLSMVPIAEAPKHPKWFYTHVESGVICQTEDHVLDICFAFPALFNFFTLLE